LSNYYFHSRFRGDDTKRGRGDNQGFENRSNLTQDFFVSVAPVRVDGFDHFYLPGSVPLLYLLFPCDGSHDVFVKLEPDETIYIVLPGKSIDEFVSMLTDSMRQIRTDAGVKDAVILAG
jgi:hypothetical protein